MNKNLLFFLCLIVFGSCAKDYRNQAEVYNNDFESGDLTGISNAEVETFNNTRVLGRYNNSGFELSLSGLPEHDLVEVSFDLYIHDAWDGNKLGEEGIEDGPDIWEMLLDGESYIKTTFSNSACPTGFCEPQSYPHNYPNNNNNPKTGASNRNLPGVCSKAGMSGWTTLYKIVRRIKHSDQQMVLKCIDQLKQSNSPDEKCDESWSIDNLKVKAIRL